MPTRASTRARQNRTEKIGPRWGSMKSERDLDRDDTGAPRLLREQVPRRFANEDGRRSRATLVAMTEGSHARPGADPGEGPDRASGEDVLGEAPEPIPPIRRRPWSAWRVATPVAVLFCAPRFA